MDMPVTPKPKLAAAKTPSQNASGQAESEGQNQADNAPESIEPGSFYIDLRPRLIKIPDNIPKENIDIRYPLIMPYAFAHIYWNNEMNELSYDIEEPILDDTERELLRLIQLGLEEMINVSFVKTQRISYIMK